MRRSKIHGPRSSGAREGQHASLDRDIIQDVLPNVAVPPHQRNGTRVVLLRDSARAPTRHKPQIGYIPSFVAWKKPRVKGLPIWERKLKPARGPPVPDALLSPFWDVRHLRLHAQLPPFKLALHTTVHAMRLRAIHAKARAPALLSRLGRVMQIETCDRTLRPRPGRECDDRFDARAVRVADALDVRRNPQRTVLLAALLLKRKHVRDTAARGRGEQRPSSEKKVAMPMVMMRWRRWR
eukprot:9486310-Pyramimonas_sp.AAC.1